MYKASIADLCFNFLVALGALSCLGCPPSNQPVVPDVIGMSQASAQAALATAGLAMGDVAVQYSASVPAGQVMSEDPVADSSVSRGTPVNIVVSGGSPDAITIMLPGDVPLELVKIRKGQYLQGRYPDELDSQLFESYQHLVTFTYDFYLGKYPVTRAQWTAMMPMAPHPWLGQLYVQEDPNAPAVYIGRESADTFIARLNLLWPGAGFGLPSEAEWEYACRAGTTTRFFWGDDPTYTDINKYVWWHGNAGGAVQAYAHTVGQKWANPWGLFDMGGNVTEMCADSWFDPSIYDLPLGISYGYSADPVTDPPLVTAPAGIPGTLCRGGHWNSAGDTCRSAHRWNFSGGGPGAMSGFRVAFDLR